MLRKWRIMLIAMVLVVLAIVVSLVVQVEDWGRDLSTNRAVTSLDSPDPTLRSLKLSASAEEIKAAISQFIEQSSLWDFHPAPKNDQAAVALVRTTRLFRFADDIEVFLQPTDQGTQVDVHSQSRVGKGDLGQNPRNIRELLSAIRGALE